MELTLLAHTRTPEGLFNIDLRIDKKRYTYILNSEYFLRKFLQLYKRKVIHGRAIAFLNKNKTELAIRE